MITDALSAVPEVFAGPLGEPDSPLAVTNAAVGVAATGVTAAPVFATFANTLSGLVTRFPTFFWPIFGFRRRKDRWWLVLDSDLGKPIVGAVVQVFDSVFGKLRETQVTNKDGQCGFLLPPGTYTVLLQKAGFIFPATRTPPITLQKNEQWYRGGELVIPAEGAEHPEQLPHLILSMDREHAVHIARVALRRGIERLIAFFNAISFPMLIIGATLNTLFLVYRPVWLNVLFEVLYVVLFLTKIVLAFTRQKGIGTIVDAKTGKPINLAAIRVFSAETNHIVQTRVTGTGGQFFLLLPKGRYLLMVLKPGYRTFVQRDLEVKGRRARAVNITLEMEPETSTPSPPTDTTA